MLLLLNAFETYLTQYEECEFIVGKLSFLRDNKETIQIRTLFEKAGYFIKETSKLPLKRKLEEGKDIKEEILEAFDIYVEKQLIKKA